MRVRILTVMVCMVVGILCLSCTESQKDPDIRAVELHAGETLPPLTSEFMRLEVPETFKLGSFDQLASDDRYIYLLQGYSSHRGLYVFDKNGAFVAKVGNYGRGAGEYQLPLSISVEKDRILLLDGGKNYVMIYTKEDWAFQDKMKIFNTSYFEPIDEHIYVCVNDEYESGNPFFEKQYVITDTLFLPQYGFVDKAIFSGYETGPSRPMYRYNGLPRAYTQYNPYVYEFDDSECHPVYELKFGEYRLPPVEYLRQISAGGRDYYDDLTDSGYISYYSVYETSDQLQIDFFTSHKKKIGFYSKRTSEGFYAPKEAWQDAYPFSSLMTKGTLDDWFVSIMLVSDLREEPESEYPEGLKSVLAQCSDNDLILWKFKLAE